MVKRVIFISDSFIWLVHMNDEILQLSQKLIKDFIPLYGFWTVSRPITWCLITLKGSNLVKWLLSAWSFMWWCQFIDWLKFEACPSSLHNFGMTYQSSLCIFLQVNKVLLQNCNSKEIGKCSGYLVSSYKLSSDSYPCLTRFNTFSKSLDLFTISPYLKSYVSFLVSFEN